MGCGGSSAAAAQEPRPRVQVSNGMELTPGQAAIIRNCPNARLNGERVILQEYNNGLGEWTVKGDKFPLSIGMSLGAQFLDVVEPVPTLLTSDKCQQSANKGTVEFTDTDGDKVVLKDNNTLGIDFYVNDVLRVVDLIRLRVDDHTIILEGYSADKWAAATVPNGQEHILNQALNLFADIQSRKGL